MTRMSATEVARSFSDVLNRVGAGEEIEIVRNGAPVALLSPSRARLLPASRLRTLLASLPPVDDQFAEDLRRDQTRDRAAGGSVGVLIDSDVFIDHQRGGRSLEEVVADEPWGISVITVSELLHGVRRARDAAWVGRRAWVEELLAGAEAVPITMPVARVHAELWAALAERGTMIGQHDLWIAATALAHGLGVVTRNESDFARVPGLRVVAV